MKNLFLGLFMLAGTAMFANTSVETSEVTKENAELALNIQYESTYYKVLGMCNIRIIDRTTGTIVYEIDLPANTPEACEHMMQNTLKAFVEGKL